MFNQKLKQKIEDLEAQNQRLMHENLRLAAKNREAVRSYFKLYALLETLCGSQLTAFLHEPSVVKAIAKILNKVDEQQQ